MTRYFRVKNNMSMSKDMNFCHSRNLSNKYEKKKC